MSCQPPVNLRYSGTTPIWVWVVTFVVSSIILIITFFCSRNQTEDIAVEDTVTFLNSSYNIARLQSFKTVAKTNSPFKIIVIGTSLTRQAFYKDEEMEHLALANGLKIRFLRFTKSGGKLSSFKNLAEFLLQAKPDLICFESALFALNFNQNQADHQLYIKKVIKKTLEKLIPKSILNEYSKIAQKIKWEKFYKENFIDPNINVYTRTEKDIVLYQTKARNLHIRNFSYGDIYKHFFEQAKKQGTKIVFLDLSRSKAAWDMLPPDTEKQIINLMHSYQKTYNIQYIRFPYRLSLDYFIDYAHFSAKGRKFYSLWFLKQIPHLLNRNGK